MDFKAFPVRSAGLLHGVISAILLVLAVFLEVPLWGAAVIAVALFVTHWVLAKTTEALVSPAYSDGHPLVNLPPELGGPANTEEPS